MGEIGLDLRGGREGGRERRTCIGQVVEEDDPNDKCRYEYDKMAVVVAAH